MRVAQRKRAINTRAISSRDIKNYFIIVGVMTGTFLLIAGIIVFIYFQLAIGSEQDKPSKNAQGGVSVSEGTDKEGGFIANLLLPPEKTNFVIMGVDKGESLTDVILVGSFDRNTQEIGLISVPRDTYIELSKEDVKALNDIGRHPPEHGVMKINALHGYAGKSQGPEYLRKQLEKMLGIEIQYYVEVNLKAFRTIVDLVGGVEMDIPAGGLHYEDPYQDLVIDVPGGRQTLDGEMAEGVVRFRDTYARGDLKRIEVQQDFMKLLFKQLMNKDTIINNAGGFVTTIISHVRTDFGVQDIPQYLRYVSDLSAEKFTIQTLPGGPQDIGGGSYFVYVKEATATLVEEIFFAKKEPEETTSGAAVTAEASAEPTASPTATPAPSIDVKSLKLQVLNGTDKSGLAGAKKAILTADGFNVQEIGDYGGTQKTYTRVMVRQAGIATYFKPYFKEVIEEIDEALPTKFDVVIILGTGEEK